KRKAQAISITIHSGLKTKILEALGEASKDLKAPAEWLRGLETHFERRDDGGIYFFDRIWIPSVGGVKKLIMDESHTSRYSIHPSADKMYYDLRDLYWWPGMKRDIAEYVSRCLTCSKIKAEHQKPSGLLQQPEIPEWKLEKLAMDLVIKFPRSSSGTTKEDSEIWAIVENLDKQKELNMRQRRWLELLKDYDTNIQYHPRMANVVAGALSRKSRMLANLQIEPGIIKDVEQAQKEDVDLWAVFQKSKEDEQTKFRVDDDGVMWFGDRLCVPSDPTLREANGMKQDIATYVRRCLICQQVKIEHQRTSRLFQPLDIPVWKWDKISMDFVTGLPRTQKKNDAIWVVVDRLTKSAYFLPIRKNFSISILADISRRGYKYHPLHVVSYPLDQIREDLSLAEEPKKNLDCQE
nr:retrotransposon protein, putative, Ty3-gypsy subclass [Tanacetum cinerariifolium]